MLLLIQIAITITLLMIFVQDIKSKSVYWVLFPVLAALFTALYVQQHRGISGLWQMLLFNLCFIIFQLVMVSIWFSIRQRALVNITKNLLGWGDILFLLCLVFCFSPANFVLFYIGSLLIVLMVWVTGKSLFKDNKHIPLAGMQALILLIILMFTWLKPGVDITSDNWLIQMLH